MRSVFVAVLVFLGCTLCLCAEIEHDLDDRLQTPSFTTPQPFTCSQRDRCAKRPDDLPFHATNCFCDEWCDVYGDCCRDYTRTSRKKVKLARNTVSCERRPQIYQEGEVYIVKSCPKDFSDDFVREKCEDERATGEFLQLPVTGAKTRILYRNVYCAMCADDHDVRFWTVKITCSRKPSRFDAAHPVASLLGVSACILEFDHPIDLPFRKCKSHLSKCDRSFQGDQRTERKCKSYTSFVYASLHVFKNKHCAVCNHVNETYLSCQDTRTPLPSMNGEPLGYAPPFSLSVDINEGKAKTSESRNSESVIEANVEVTNCGNGHIYNPFQEVCVLVHCRRGQVFYNGQCVDEGTIEVTTSPSGGTEEMTITELVGSSSLFMETTPLTTEWTSPMTEAVTTKVIHLRTTSRTHVKPHDPSFGDGDDHLNCPSWMKVNSTDHHYLSNGSIFIRSLQRAYDAGEYYRIGGKLYVCLPMTEPIILHTPANLSATVHMFKFSVVQSLLSLIGQVMSISALFVVLIVYVLFSQLRDLQGMCILSLVASLIIAQCLFLFGTPRIEIGVVCLSLAAVMHFFFLAAFLWVNVLAIDICRTFAAPSSARQSTSCARFSAYSFYAWTLPALIVAGSVVLDLLQMHPLYRPRYGDGLCWITSRRALLVLFALPMAILLFVNIVLFTVTIIHICALDRATQKALKQGNFGLQATPTPPSLIKERSRFIVCIQLSFIMGLTWVFGFLAALTDLQVLWYVFIVFNTLQGVFICAAFVCNKRVLRLVRRTREKENVRTSTSNGRLNYSRPSYLFDSDACVIAQETSI